MKDVARTYRLIYFDLGSSSAIRRKRSKCTPVYSYAGLVERLMHWRDANTDYKPPKGVICRNIVEDPESGPSISFSDVEGNNICL